MFKERNWKFHLLILLTIFTGLIGYAIGHHQGENDVINNQIIFDEAGNEGDYYAVYDGEKYNYWFENGDYTDPRYSEFMEVQ